jgi:Uma2 family endonuclease
MLAAVDDLIHVPDKGKAELVRGKVVLIEPQDGRGARMAGRILASLMEHEALASGVALPSRVAFIVDLPNRGSFSPDVSWFVGDADGMGYPVGAPAFAVEVRRPEDYVPAAERAIAAKIADYFAAGTLVVWDVDLLSDDIIRVHRAGRPDLVDIFRKGEMADAEPAVPRWRFPVDRLLTKGASKGAGGI